jgi:hypothetical protein
MPSSVLQINIDVIRTLEPHRPDARSISILQEVCSQKSTLIAKFQYSVRTTRHHVRTTQQHLRTIYSNSDNSIISFERGKDFSEDRPDAWLSRLDTHLIRIRYALFLKDIAETRPDGANFRLDGRQTESYFQQFSRSLEAYK